VNSPATRRIEPDPERAPIITKLFEWYATGNVSLRALTQKAAAAGLTNRANGKPLVRAKIHQLLQNPIYSGDFMWLGRMYEGQPLIGRDLFERVQRVFVAANHPPHGTKRQHSFVGLVKCARCGCSFTAELKKGQYVYYHCTGAKGPCGNSYIREEDLGTLLGDVVKRSDTDRTGRCGREGPARGPVRQRDFRAGTTMRLQQQELTIRKTGSCLRRPSERTNSRRSVDQQVSRARGGTPPPSATVLFELLVDALGYLVMAGVVSFKRHENGTPSLC
jgi:hypothetical protein